MMGRKVERALVDGILARARQGQAGILVFEGEPGVGKTELCDYAVGAAIDMTVVRVIGVEFESELPLAGLFELLRPLRHLLDHLPDAQRLAAQALLDADGLPGVDLFALATAVLSLLSLEAEHQPVVLVIDDCQWLDPLTGQALAFALRRLDADAVAVVLTTRSGQPFALPGRCQKVLLAGLDVADAGPLLHREAGLAVTDQVVESIVALTGGNPLALIEAARILGADELTGAVPLPEPLPMGQRGEVSFGARLAHLPSRTRAALAVVAIAGAAPTAAINEAVANVGGSPADLEPAEKAGVIAIRDGRPGFTHPLLRAAAVARLDGPSRRHSHATVADALTDVDLERRAWHLAAAATGPSEPVAAALEEAAANATRRAGTAAAATSLALAAELSPPGPARVGRLARAGEALYVAGRREQATHMVDQLLRTGDTEARTHALLLRANLAVWSDTVAEAPPLLWAAFEELSGASADAAAMVGMQLAVILGSLGRLRDMSLITQRVGGLEIGNNRVRIAAECTHALSSAFLGDCRPVSNLADRNPPHQILAQLGPGSGALSTLVEALIFAERYDAAETLIGAQLYSARARSAASLLPFPLYARSDIDLRKGNIVEAGADGDETLMLGEMTGFRGLQGLAHGLRARAAALEGHADSCRLHAAKAADLASRLKQLPPELFLNHALALLELATGQPAIAADHLRRNVELEKIIGVGTPAVVPWRADYVEALARDGQHLQALEALEDLERQGRAAQSPWAAAVALRCRALLMEGDWEAHGEQAVADLATLPFEQGRAQLILGEQLRRNHQPSKARRHLKAAAEAFTACGATPWVARAQEELRAAGGRTINRATPGQPLSHQELQVSRLAADGATNKEIAAALFISQKTVEYHLQKAFAKLGATNRTHAARLLRLGLFNQQEDH